METEDHVDPWRHGMFFRDVARFMHRSNMAIAAS